MEFALDKDFCGANVVGMNQEAPSPAVAALIAWLAREGRRKDWLARQIETTPETLSRWIGGRHLPLPIYRAKIADVTGGAVPVEAWD